MAAATKSDMDALKVFMTEQFDSIQKDNQDLKHSVSKLEESVSTLKDSVSTLKHSVSKLEESVSTLKDSVSTLKDSVSTLKDSVSALVERSMSDGASELFGKSFSKPFVIKSLYDAVHLVAKAGYGGLHSDAHEERGKAAEKLAKKAMEYREPLAWAMLNSFVEKYRDLQIEGSNNEEYRQRLADAEHAFQRREFVRGIGMLIQCCRLGIKSGSGLLNVQCKLVKLKKAFSPDADNHDHGSPFLLPLWFFKADKSDDEMAINDSLLGNLMSCDGPGVMLLQIGSMLSESQLRSHNHIFDQGYLHEELELDMRGMISLIDHDATISCGEVKTNPNQRQAGENQLVKRVVFLKMVVETIFPSTFTRFVLIGRLFSPKDSLRKHSGGVSNIVRGGNKDPKVVTSETGGDRTRVSIYQHYI